MDFIKVVHFAHRYFTVENPKLSWLWWLPEWITFKQTEGVIATVLQQRCYGWITRKDTFMLHNSPVLDGIGTSDVHCPPSDIVLRGKCGYEGREVFRTKLSQSYPPRLAIAYGILAKSAMETHSEAVGRGLPIPHAISIFDDGLPSEEPCDEEYDNMPDLIDVDDEFEDWRSQLKVPHGNNLPCGLSPLEQRSKNSNVANRHIVTWLTTSGPRWFQIGAHRRQDSNMRPSRGWLVRQVRYRQQFNNGLDLWLTI